MTDEKRLSSYFESVIRPKIRAHHGDVEITKIENNTVFVRLVGECANCPSASLTAEYTIKDAVLREFPSIKDVILDQSVSQELLDQARQILLKRKY